MTNSVAQRQECLGLGRTRPVGGPIASVRSLFRRLIEAEARWADARRLAEMDDSRLDDMGLYRRPDGRIDRRAGWDAPRHFFR